MQEVLDTQLSPVAPQIQGDSADDAPSGSLKDIHFRLTVFEGPLDLLLHLIKENKVDIYDIPIVQITRQYIEYIDMMKELNLEIAGEFLVMAATLIHIKSKMLLPSSSEEEEEAGEDPRAELVRRLLEYERMKKAAQALDQLPQVGRDVVAVTVWIERTVVEQLPGVDAQDLAEAWRRLLHRRTESRHGVAPSSQRWSSAK